MINLLKQGPRYFIKAINSAARIIAMTGYASLEAAMAALRAGACDCPCRTFEDIEQPNAKLDDFGLSFALQRG